MPQETLPEEVEDQIHTCFSDDEIAEYESRLPKLDYWYKGIQGLLPGQDSVSPDAMKNTNMVFAWEQGNHMRQKMFPLAKMAPVRESTLTTAEEIFKQTAHSDSVYAHTCLCNSRKEIDTTSRNIAACYTAVMDLDYLPEINKLDENGNYVMSTERAATYLLLYPRFCRFFKMLPPSIIVRTGKKVHRYTSFSIKMSGTRNGASNVSIRHLCIFFMPTLLLVPCFPSCVFHTAAG